MPLFTARIVSTSPDAFLTCAPAETPQPISESEIHIVFSHAVPPIRILAQISIHPKFVPWAAISAIRPLVGAFGGTGSILSGLSNDKASEREDTRSITVTITEADVKCPRAIFAVIAVSDVQLVTIAAVPNTPTRGTFPNVYF